jgi:hypothetical protein
MVGRLTDDAREAYDEIEQRLRNAAQGFEAADIWDAQSWLYGDHTTLSLAIALEIGADASDEELAAVVESQREEARRQEILLIGDLAKEIRGVRDHMRNLAEEAAPSP